MDAFREHRTAEDTSGNVHTEREDHANVVQMSQSGSTRQWTIKGISPDAVDISREAARRSGMKLNSWVGLALRRAAETSPSSEDMDYDQLAKRVATLEGYIKAEFDRLRLQSAQIESTVNCISALLLKMYMKVPPST